MPYGRNFRGAVARECASENEKKEERWMVAYVLLDLVPSVLAKKFQNNLLCVDCDFKPQLSESVKLST